MRPKAVNPGAPALRACRRAKSTTVAQRRGEERGDHLGGYSRETHHEGNVADLDVVEGPLSEAPFGNITDKGVFQLGLIKIEFINTNVEC